MPYFRDGDALPPSRGKGPDVRFQAKVKFA